MFTENPTEVNKVRPEALQITIHQSSSTDSLQSQV